MDWKRITLSTLVVAAVATAPFASADAHRRRNPLLWPFVAGAAVVGTAAAVATAPLRAVAPPYYSPYAYPAYSYPPGYYGYYGAPGYYAPAPAYSYGYTSGY